MLSQFWIDPAIAADDSEGYAIEDFYVPATGYPLSDRSGIYWKDMNYFSVKRTNNSAQFRVYCEYVVDKSSVPMEWLSSDVILNDDLDADSIMTTDELADNYNDRLKYYEKRGSQTLSNPYFDIVEKTLDLGSKKYSIIAKKTADFGDEKIIYHHGTRAFIYENHYCKIYCELKTSNPQDVKGKLDLIEARMMEIFSKPLVTEKYTLKITHYHPFSSECLKNPAQYPPGELSIRLKDEQGRGVEGKTVYLFVEKYYDEQTVWGRQPAEVLTFDRPHNAEESLGRYPLPYFTWLQPVGCPPADAWYGGYTVLTTDSSGFASYNYFEKGFLNYERLEKYLRRDGKAYVKVWAIVLDQEVPPPGVYTFYGKTFRVLANDSITIEFDSVAVIKDVGSTKGRVPMVVVERPGDTKGQKSVQKEDLPFKLRPDDSVLLDDDDKALIQWLSGTKFEVIAKSESISKEEPYAVIWIGAKDLGWYQWVNQKYKSPSITGAISFTGAKLTCLVVGGTVPVTAVVGGAIAVLGFGWYVADSYFSPIVVLPRSTFLVDYGGDNLTLSTIEGNVTLVNRDDQAVSITDGHKVDVSSTGSYGSLKIFTESDLSNEQREALEDLRHSAASPSPTAAAGGIDDYNSWEEADEFPFCCPCMPFALLPLLLVLVVTRSRRLRH